MLAAARSAAVLGIDAYPVTVEVDAAQGLPQFTTVGLPAGAVKESRERVGAALVNSGFALPPRRITVNLAPADVRKDGTAFDLPIAIAALIATGQLPPDAADGLLIVGELGLDGTLRAVRGGLPISALAARERRTLVLPEANAPEAALVGSTLLSTPADLRTLVEALRAGAPPPCTSPRRAADSTRYAADFADVAGQEGAKRALEIAAAGGHNVALIGPPGAGKTMLARRLPTILPPLAEQEALEVIAIHSVAGLLPHDSAFSRRPFRAPHHTISAAGLIGGGSMPRPGEVSLAHHGVLFLDEMLEFPRTVLDALRQPLEDGQVVIARAAQAVTFPARFTLVGAMNPCPCGRGSSHAGCICSAADILRYRARLSGPLADRIDMHVTVAAVPIASLSAARGAEASSAVRGRVERARALQRDRYRALSGVECNARVPARWMESHADATDAARALLRAAAERLELSARGYHRVLRVARTIADLEGARELSAGHVAEALRYRPVSSAPSALPLPAPDEPSPAACARLAGAGVSPCADQRHRPHRASRTPAAERSSHVDIEEQETD